MVTNIDAGDTDQPIEDLTPVAPDVISDTPDIPIIEETTNDVLAVPEATTPEQPIITDTPPAPVAPATQPVDQAAIDELRQHRQANQDREWFDKLGKQARSYEQQLNNQGYLPEQAREQARRYMQGQQQHRQQEQKSAEMVGFVEGRQAAAIHFMKENGLASQQMLDDLNALQRANSPDDMKREAARMKRERALIAENTRLKQGLVQPQSFDNSQGAAEAQPNDARLLDAYINGDRSEAARKAVERSMSGG